MEKNKYAIFKGKVSEINMLCYTTGNPEKLFAIFANCYNEKRISEVKKEIAIAAKKDTAFVFTKNGYNFYIKKITT